MIISRSATVAFIIRRVPKCRHVNLISSLNQHVSLVSEQQNQHGFLISEKSFTALSFYNAAIPNIYTKRPKLNTDNPTTAVLIFLFNLYLSFYCFISFCLNVVDKMKRIVKIPNILRYTNNSV